MVLYVIFFIFQSVLKDEMISDVPILVLANKTDRRDAVGEEMIVGHLGVSCRTSKVSHLSYKSFCLTSISCGGQDYIHR